MAKLPPRDPLAVSKGTQSPTPSPKPRGQLRRLFGFLFPRRTLRGIRDDWCSLLREVLRAVWVGMVLVGDRCVINYFHLHGWESWVVHAVTLVLLAAIVARWFKDHFK